jgi:hypothetical protein
MHNYCMDFTNWFLKRQKTLPHADRLSALIQAAGQNGIPEQELRSSVDLPRKLFDDLLTALIGSKQIGVIERDGMRIYFSRF